MDDQLTPAPDFIDLLFEKRNKEYGAYQIRKKYHSTVITGTILACILGSLAVLIPFMIRPPDDRPISGGVRYVQVEMENLQPPEEQIFIPAPSPPGPPQEDRIMKYVAPEIVDTVFSMEIEPLATDVYLDQPIMSDEFEIPAAAGTGDYLFAEEGFGYGEGGSGGGDFYVIVEEMPAFRGGDLNNFRLWVQRRTNYPQEAIERNVEGRVYLTFIVEPDGAVSNVTVVKGVDPIIDNEAVRAVEASPRWSPGLQRGQPVRVRFSISLNFEI